MTLEERFNAKWEPEPNSGCWLWTGARGKAGYGLIGEETFTLLAHRVSYHLHRGPIPEGLQIDHLCRNRACVNPAHLDVVTAAVNIQRGWLARPPRPVPLKKLPTFYVGGHSAPRPFRYNRRSPTT